MKYLVTAMVQFEVDADGRPAAHVAAVDALLAAELPAFDMWDLDVVADVPGDAPARTMTIGEMNAPVTRGTAYVLTGRDDLTGANDPTYAPMPVD